MLSIPFVTIQSSSLRDLWEAEWTERDQSFLIGIEEAIEETIRICKGDQLIEKEMRLNGINTENKDKEKKNKDKFIKEQKQLEHNIEGTWNGQRDRIGKQSEQGNY